MIIIKSIDLENIIVHCKSEVPVEACGVLAGTIRDLNGVMMKKVLKVYDCRNELNSPTKYKLGAKDQFDIFSEIDELGLNLLGFYHSHPYNSSRPSLIDIVRANYYGYSYMIIALQSNKVSSWVLEKKGVFKEEKIQKN